MYLFCFYANKKKIKKKQTNKKRAVVEEKIAAPYIGCILCFYMNLL